MRRQSASGRRAYLLSPGQLWGLRAIALGGVLLIAALIGALVLLGTGGDEDGAADGETELSESLTDANAGISVRWPSAWKQLERGGKLVFRSPGGGVVLAVSAPAPAAEAAQVRKATIAATTELYTKPRVGRGRDRTIGGLEAAGAVISGRGPNGPSRTLVAVAAGRTKTYVLEVYAGAGVDEASLAGAQLILNSLEFTK